MTWLLWLLLALLGLEGALLAYGLFCGWRWRKALLQAQADLRTLASTLEHYREP